MMNLREWALPVYTILMQLASGALMALWIIRSLLSTRKDKIRREEFSKTPLLIIFFTVLMAMIGAHFHLSKPYLSSLAVSNFSRSWLSREIVLTVIFFFLTGILVVLHWRSGRHSILKDALGWIAILVSGALIYCMARIYLLPTQIVWNTHQTIFLYYAQSILLGTVTLSAMLLMDLNLSIGYKERKNLDVQLPTVKRAFLGLTITAVVTSLVILCLDLYHLYILRTIEHPSVQVSLSLLTQLYFPLLLSRFAFLILGIGWLVISLSQVYRKNKPVYAVISTVYISSMLIMVAEILERFLFYATHVRLGI